MFGKAIALRGVKDREAFEEADSIGRIASLSRAFRFGFGNEAVGRGVEMVSDLDIWRSAASMMKTHGDGAAMACAELVDRWERRGDTEAAQTWRRIQDATRALTQCDLDCKAS